jgi:hypothetical protein
MWKQALRFQQNSKILDIMGNLHIVVTHFVNNNMHNIKSQKKFINIYYCNWTDRTHEEGRNADQPQTLHPELQKMVLYMNFNVY